MNKKFEFIEHTADSKFKAHGKTITEAFENAALALFETMTDTSQIDLKTTEFINLETNNLEELLYNWLSELVYLFSAKNIVFSDFKVKINKNKKYRLKGKVKGEKIDLSKHKFNTEVKAVTYHDLDIKKNDEYIAQVLLDT